MEKEGRKGEKGGRVKEWGRRKGSRSMGGTEEKGAEWKRTEERGRKGRGVLSQVRLLATRDLIYIYTYIKRDHIPHIKMHILQRSVFPQHSAQSKSNAGVLCRRNCCINDAEMKS